MTGSAISLIPNRTDVEIEPAGSQVSLYLSNKIKIIEPLILELGVRYDKTSYTDENLLSPRVNLFYAIDKRTFIRGALGRFNQPQGLNELRVQMGERTFNAAQLSNHYLLGFEHHFLNGVNLRVEAYYKSNSRKKPDYRQYAPPADIEMFPEMSYENIKVYTDHSIAKGIEVYLKYDTGGAISFWGSYALSSVEDFINNVESAGNVIPVYGNYPGVSDQRHTFYFDLNYRPDKNWHINVAWQFHSGWPYSELINSDNMSEEEKYQAAMDNYLQSNYPSYHRLDVRVNRYFDTSIGRISLFVELINLYSRDNVRAYDYIFSQDMLGRERLQKQAVPWLPLLPSIGFSWEYDF
ncbi:MAG: TonB-dependent receptor, partial [bacterium]